ncbi:MAG: Ig-like domain-containing protein, partial [Oscillospiraceae bacterium]|nr:Ig-like domain-containing protein [Oscillospiraceae bacterium]
RTVMIDSDSHELEVTAATVPVTGVSLDQHALTLNIGQTGALVATVSPVSADDTTVTWTSSNPNITVTGTGLSVQVSGSAAGTGTITVTTNDGGLTDTCAVIINTVVVPVDSVSLNKNTMELHVGGSDTLTYSILPANATDDTVTWATSDASVATVLGGVVSAVATGSATITVTTNDGGKTATCAVTVTPTGGNDPTFPSDKNDVASKTGINAGDLVETGGKVYLSGNAASAIAKTLLGSSAATGAIEPVFEITVNPDGSVARISFSVKGNELLASYADDINLVGMVSGNSGQLFDYANSLADVGDMKFTLLKNGVVYTGEIDPNDTYEIVFGIKDGGLFDMDDTADGEVIGSVFFASDGKKKSGGGGGCSAGYELLALALLATPLISRKRK